MSNYCGWCYGNGCDECGESGKNCDARFDFGEKTHNTDSAAERVRKIYLEGCEESESDEEGELWFSSDDDDDLEEAEDYSHGIGAAHGDDLDQEDETADADTGGNFIDPMLGAMAEVFSDM